MKRINIRIFVCVFILTTFLCNTTIACNFKDCKDSEAYQVPHHIKLSWETSPVNSQAVSWRTQASITESYLEYTHATASPFFENKTRVIKAHTDSLTVDDGLWQYHSVNIEDLEPNTVYSYRVGCGDLWSDWSEFTTASGENGPFMFLYFGDLQRDIYSLGSRVLHQAVLANPNTKFMLFAGDMVHRGGLNKENWDEFFRAGGWIFQNIPTIATPGNHEHLIAKSGENISPLWFLNYRFPRNGPAGHEEETYYIDYNNVRIISLNLCRYKYPEDRKELYKWTEERLKEFKGDWVLITQHYNMVGSARNRSEEIRFPEFKELFERYKVPLVLTGHEHVYARGRMNADFPVYVVSVAGPYQNAILFGNWLERAGTSMQLYQEIHITPDSLQYISKTLLGDIYDEFVIIKRKNGNFTFLESKSLPPESLIPPKDFEQRYKEELVRTYEKDKSEYLERQREKKLLINTK